MRHTVDQFVEEVTDFSSQYGSIGSISYVASNLSGGITLFPDYGDSAGSYNMRTYGKWWKICPSAAPPVPDPYPMFKPSMDFVDVLYETAVYPISVNVYETYNPGSVVRIWGSFKGKRWVLLWSGEALPQPPVSRIFSPPINEPDFLINLLRLEFDQSNHEYHCGFEAVVLVGSTNATSDIFQPHCISHCLRKRGIFQDESDFSEECIVEGAKFLLSEEFKSMDFSQSSGEESDLVDRSGVCAGCGAAIREERNEPKESKAEENNIKESKEENTTDESQEKEINPKKSEEEDIELKKSKEPERKNERDPIENEEKGKIYKGGKKGGKSGKDDKGSKNMEETPIEWTKKRKECKENERTPEKSQEKVKYCKKSKEKSCQHLNKPSCYCEVELEGGDFSKLPEELLIHIMKLLDIRSLCRLGGTCKMLKAQASLPLFYQHLNLKNCWWVIKDSTFIWLSQMCSQLKYLDLSWCGPYGGISSHIFMEFINSCGHNLVVLHLNNCHFIDNYCLYIIVNICSKLEVLSLSACTKIDHLGFGELKQLTKLRFLDLSRTGIEFGILHVLLQTVVHLEHLHLHYCKSFDLDLVAQTLRTFNQSLVSLGAWKTHGLTSRGLKSLAGISSLQELDLGWAFDRQTALLKEGLTDLMKGTSGLKKLFLTAFRGLTDEEIDILSTYGKSLEQLDVMGSRNISPDAVLRLLEQCEKLQLLDVSYCEKITPPYILRWKRDFPLIYVKGGQKNDISLS